MVSRTRAAGNEVAPDQPGYDNAASGAATRVGGTGWTDAGCDGSGHGAPWLAAVFTRCVAYHWSFDVGGCSVREVVAGEPRTQFAIP